MPFYTESDFSDFAVAILIPCQDEAASIFDVVVKFKHALPLSKVYVYDNNSRDGTPEIAEAANAIVLSEIQQGKGQVVKRMFSEIEADIYVLVDGDGTYDPFFAPQLINKLISEKLDLVNGKRKICTAGAFRFGHKIGNQMLSKLIGYIFGKQFDDVLSGYKIFSRRFVKTFPALSQGFEIECELVVHALNLKMPVAELETKYMPRPQGSTSKLRTFHDGFAITKMIFYLMKKERPLIFFILLFLPLAGSSIALAIPIFQIYLESGMVSKVPSVISSGLMLLACITFSCGLILNIGSSRRRKVKRLFYLSSAWQKESRWSSKKSLTARL